MFPFFYRITLIFQIGKKVLTKNGLRKEPELCSVYLSPVMGDLMVKDLWWESGDWREVD